MKKLLFIFIIVLLVSPAIAEEDKASEKPYCPTTKISDNDKCMSCHRMVFDENGKQRFGLKELPIDANYYDMPGSIDLFLNENGKLVPRVRVSGTGNSELRRSADYLYRHPEFKELVVDLFTPGGSVMQAWESVGIIQEMQNRGIKVITRSYGLTASAGVVLLVAGDERIVNPHTEIMMHKLWSFQMFKIDTPDTAEDQAETMKHFQKNINDWIIARSHLTKEKIEQCIYKKDFWMTGREALEFGLATRFIR